MQQNGVFYIIVFVVAIVLCKTHRTKMTYFTQNFAQLNDSRKLEEIVSELIKISFRNDFDNSEYRDLLEQLLEYRLNCSN